MSPWRLPADGRCEGPGTPARLKATPISLADASRVPGPGAGPPHLGRGPRPVPLILPSALRQFGQFRGTQPGGSRSKTSPAGVGGRGGRGSRRSHPLLRAEGSTAGSSGRGFGEGQGYRSVRPSCSRSDWARSRPPWKRGVQSSRSRCAAHARSCPPTSGCSGRGRSRSRSAARSDPTTAGRRRSCGSATRLARRSHGACERGRGRVRRQPVEPHGVLREDLACDLARLIPG
jgi:hypothetical protein